MRLAIFRGAALQTALICGPGYVQASVPGKQGVLGERAHGHLAGTGGRRACQLFRIAAWSLLTVCYDSINKNVFPHKRGHAEELRVLLLARSDGQMLGLPALGSAPS